MFCDICIGVLQHRHRLVSAIRPGDPDYDARYGPEYTFGHHATCASLAASAIRGCPVCQNAWNKLSSVEQESVRAADSRKREATPAGTLELAFVTTAHLGQWVMPNTFSFSVRYRENLFADRDKYSLFILEPDESKSFHSRIRTFVDHGTDCTPSQNSHVQLGYTSDRTSSAESMQMAAKWLQECVSSHLSCNKSEGSSTWNPTRLLHLVDDSGDKNYVRLIRTAQELPVGPYATLSHCWGNKMPFQLTRAMESESNLRFLLADLPRTFQEAIQVSRQLGIFYLWIDSLCIIQSGDDRQDWYREASLMDMVYTNSHCNISATDAEDSTKGLFRHRPPLHIGRPRVKVCLDGFQQYTEHVECLMTDYVLWPHVLKYSPLNKRGWVFQERYLAPRVLHFGRHQLFWECREHTVCETFPQALPPVSLYYSPPFLKSRQRNEHRLSGKSSSKERIMDEANETNWETLWHPLVREYSRKKLTVPGDKLVALSGVARHIMPRIKDTYVAGMWRKGLEIMLIWEVTSIGTRPPNYRAPSWSWASVDGLVWLNFGVERKSLIRVEDVVLDYATEDTTGAVTGGWLDLRGCLKPMRLQSIKRNGRKEWNMVVRSSIVSKHDTNDTDQELTAHLDSLYGEDMAFEDDNTEERLFFMPALIDGSSDARSTLRCLLFRLTESKNNAFERIGVARCPAYHKKEMLLAELGEETKARLPCLRYENGLHTIRIV